VTAVYSWVQGDEIDLVVTTDDSITGATDIQFVLQRDAIVYLRKSVGSGITEDSSTQFTVSLSEGDTENLLGFYRAQGLFIDSSGKKKAIRLTDSSGNIVDSVEIHKRLSFL